MPEKTAKRSSCASVPNRGRHEASCRVCAHPQRDEIEHDFICWKSPARITDEYKLRNRASVYRHAHALDLFPKRSRNIRAALERIIERVDDAQVTAAGVVQAIAAYTKMAEPDPLGTNALFEKMNAKELEAYAKDGSLPSWFTPVAGATKDLGPGGNENG